MASKNPPLAGRPPFATDEPDTIYESSPSPQRRVRMQAPPDPNGRTSAYDVYDNYIDGSNRQSGVGALGMGLMNGEMDDDDDEDDYASRPPPSPVPGTPTPTSKHAALAAATNRTQGPNPPPEYKVHAGNIPVQSPRPGYAAPIAALNANAGLARPAPAAVSQGRQPNGSYPNPSHPNAPTGLRVNPNASPNANQRPAYGAPSPAPSMAVPSTPHPLDAPMTPITPIFARPAKAAFPANAQFDRDVKFAPSTPIMRGDREETMLPKRGEKGDDFWRRFSMIAQEENRKPSTQKESTWLRKTQNGTTRLSRWVWIIGVILLIIIGGAIGLGWWASHNSPSHQQPEAIGGSANEVSSAIPESSSARASGGTSTSSPHVSPTNTVARRDWWEAAEAVPTGTVYIANRDWELPRDNHARRRHHSRQSNRTRH